MNKKIYLAGKITGENMDECTAKFQLFESQLSSMGLVVINPLKLNHNHGKQWHEYMHVCIGELLQCDMIFLMPCWGQSPGARVERAIALELGLPIAYNLPYLREHISKFKTIQSSCAIKNY